MALYSAERPDRPLVVKCSFDRSLRRITFASARNCTYLLLRNRVEQCFALSASSFSMSYQDDDGETTDILNEHDLTEAIHYFHVGADDNASTNGSILSGYSGRISRKITLRISVAVEYDGPSLSDTGSLVSLEEYQKRDSLSLSDVIAAGDPYAYHDEPDDDAVTISSHDTSSPEISLSESSYPGQRTSSSQLHAESAETPPTSRDHGLAPSSLHKSPSFVEPGSDKVFERLRQMDSDPFAVSQQSLPLDANERGAQWLRDQTDRAACVAPPPHHFASDSDFDAASSSMGGDLELQKDEKGKYYFNYTSDSSSHVSQVSHITESAESRASGGGERSSHRPAAARASASASRLGKLPESHTESGDLSPETLQAILESDSRSGPDLVTDCSSCGDILDSFRYVCTSCGEKTPQTREELVQSRALPHSHSTPPRHPLHPHLHPHSHRSATSPTSATPTPPHFTHRPEVVITTRSISSRSDSSGKSRADSNHSGSSRSNSASAMSASASVVSAPTTVEAGYELCSKCIATAGVIHAEEVLSGGSTAAMPTATSAMAIPVQAMGPNPGAPPAPRRPKRKVQIRHAYLEKFWGPGGWQDVELDDEVSCSICNKPLQHERYKCISCEQFNLCRAHYSQVHEIHPSHAFVAVPDKEAVIPPQALITNADEEKSMVHPGVRCNHCLQEIVGARFHCAQCEDVDICANCESAGLPGNLTSPDGGHDSSHIMIKIPLPLATAEVRMASERARALLSGRDAPAIAVGDGARGPRPRANSLESTYQKTVIGAPRSATINKDHHILCRSCNKSIIGLRYQCASCPSLPTAYNLCEDCEGISFTVHDPMHIFIKITRPVDRPIESAAPLLPPIYDIPAGQDRDGNHYGEDFKGYLRSVPHTGTYCDHCMTPIYGEWFRCANCDADFCEGCEQLKVHDSTHVFLVIKSTLDIREFRYVELLLCVRPMLGDVLNYLFP
ncbi:hypothetical protein DL93DRAFT_2061136 [Clavulina sp. PMI_390]|nr:hypothetical protein DL93DRAFT_2061136 [Clavulina sp. PMI_390]